MEPDTLTFERACTLATQMEQVINKCKSIQTPENTGAQASPQYAAEIVRTVRNKGQDGFFRGRFNSYKQAQVQFVGIAHYTKWGVKSVLPLAIPVESAQV